LKVTVFFSWQSDTRAAANRTLIQAALEGAAADLRADKSVSVEPVVDRDTFAVPGAPDIGTTIFQKIDASAAVVADVTIINGNNQSRPTPNPNVLIELGYALKSLGNNRLILIQNVAFGGPELLPFDLRQKRILTYDSPADAPSRAEKRHKLQSVLREALALVLTQELTNVKLTYPVALYIDHKDKLIRGERHDYQLQVVIKNTGTKPIKEWHVDVDFPTPLLDPDVSQLLCVPERSDHERTLFRVTQDEHSKNIYPGDKKLVMTIDYRVDKELYWSRGDLLDQWVTSTAYIDGDVAATAEKSVRDLQNF
jgi:hypothetical protein